LATTVLLQHNLSCRNPFKPGLVTITGIGPLFHLDHLKIFKNFKTMSSASQQNHIAGTQYAALQVATVITIKINPETPAFYEQNLLRVKNFSLYGIMHVGFYGLTGRMAHTGKLLREMRRGEKMYAGISKRAS
jgi:hypothetical protein